MRPCCSDVETVCATHTYFAFVMLIRLPKLTKAAVKRDRCTFLTESTEPKPIDHLLNAKMNAAFSDKHLRENFRDTLEAFMNYWTLHINKITKQSLCIHLL